MSSTNKVASIMSGEWDYNGFLVIFGSSACFFFLQNFCVCFSLHLEAPIRTEADVLAEDQFLHNSTPKRPSQDIKVTVRNFSEVKHENQKKSFKRINPKRKKGYHNYQTLFEPRTHHPYLLEMVNDFSLHSIFVFFSFVKIEFMHVCTYVCLKVTRDMLLEESSVYLNVETAFGTGLCSINVA